MGAQPNPNPDPNPTPNANPNPSPNPSPSPSPHPTLLPHPNPNQVGRRVRVDVLLATAMRTYFGQVAISRLNWENPNPNFNPNPNPIPNPKQVAISRLNWEFAWNAAVPPFRTVSHVRAVDTVLRSLTLIPTLTRTLTR